MSRDDIIRAWQDEEFRDSLSEDQQAALPDNPAGLIELNDDALATIGGAGMAADGTYHWGSAACCDGGVTVVTICPTFSTCYTLFDLNCAKQ